MARGAFSTSDYLRTSGAPVSVAPLTIAAWFYLLSQISGRLVSVAAPGNTTSRYDLRYSATGAGSLVAEAGDGVNTLTAGSNDPPALSAWQHSAAVFLAGEARVYLGAAPYDYDDSSVVAPAGLGRVGLGIRGGSSVTMPLPGYLASVAIWRAALDDAQVALLAAGRSPRTVRADDLVAWWPLVESAGDAADALGGLTAAQSGTVPGQPHPAVWTSSAAQRQALGRGILRGVA